MVRGRRLSAVRERDVKRDDEMAVPRQVDGSARALAALDQTGERKRRELSLGVGLIEAGPERGPLRRLFADRDCVQEA